MQFFLFSGFYHSKIVHRKKVAEAGLRALRDDSEIVAIVFSGKAREILAMQEHATAWNSLFLTSFSGAHTYLMRKKLFPMWCKMLCACGAYYTFVSALHSTA